MSFGLKSSDLDYIINTIKKFPQIKKAVIFGSRAKGNFKPGSDIDIVDYTHSNHEELREHIERVGKVIYENII